MTIFGTPNNEVHDDQGNTQTRDTILLKFPDAVELERVPGPCENYVHGVGYVMDCGKELLQDKQTLTDGYAATLNQGMTSSLGFDVQVNPESLTRLSATYTAMKAREALGQTPTTVFRDMANVNHALSLVEFETIILEIDDHVTPIMNQFWADKDAL